MSSKMVSEEIKGIKAVAAFPVVFFIIAAAIIYISSRMVETSAGNCVLRWLSDRQILFHYLSYPDLSPSWEALLVPFRHA